MFKPSQKKGLIDDTKLLKEELEDQNKQLSKINSKQLEKKSEKELNQKLLEKEGELKKKISLRKKTISKSFKTWLFNNNEL